MHQQCDSQRAFSQLDKWRISESKHLQMNNIWKSWPKEVGICFCFLKASKMFLMEEWLSGGHSYRRKTTIWGNNKRTGLKYQWQQIWWSDELLLYCLDSIQCLNKVVLNASNSEYIQKRSGETCNSDYSHL